MTNVDPESLPVGEDAPEIVNVVVEVPAGSRNKYEYEPEMGVIVRDRVLPGNVRYPADYGFIPSTISTAGEPVDVVVPPTTRCFPGYVLRARVIGALRTSTSQGEEPNVFAVPADDARFDEMETLEDMPEQNLRELENFFVTYMNLEGDEQAEVRGWHDREETHEIIRQSSRTYQEAREGNRQEVPFFSYKSVTRSATIRGG